MVRCKESMFGPIDHDNGVARIVHKPHAPQCIGELGIRRDIRIFLREDGNPLPVAIVQRVLTVAVDDHP